MSDRTGYLTLLYRYFFFFFISFSRSIRERDDKKNKRFDEIERNGKERERAKTQVRPYCGETFLITRLFRVWKTRLGEKDRTVRWHFKVCQRESKLFETFPASTGEFETRLFSFNEVSYLSRGYNYSALCIIQEILLEIENCQTRAGCDQ